MTLIKLVNFALTPLSMLQPCPPMSQIDINCIANGALYLLGRQNFRWDV